MWHWCMDPNAVIKTVVSCDLFYLVEIFVFVVHRNVTKSLGQRSKMPATIYVWTPFLSRPLNLRMTFSVM